MFYSPSLFNRSSSVPLLRLTVASVFVAVFSAEAADTTLVSVSSTGEQGNYSSSGSSISADGRFVAFSSWAQNLVPDDTNHTWDVFVHDRVTGQTTRVNVNSAGKQSNYAGLGHAISADGRFVVFSSAASNLVTGDTNEEPDIFIHDRFTGKTECVSVSEKGGPPKGGAFSDSSAISADGRFVAFYSYASNLVPDDTNDLPDVFVHDRLTGKTERANVSSAGIQANAAFRYQDKIAMSADGRFVTYTSQATNLVDGDTNTAEDVFVRDRATNKTELISVNTAGEQGNYSSSGSSISADGRFVAFSSWAVNLVPDDTNETTDAFVRDRVSGRTERVSVSSSGAQGNFYSGVNFISADGRFVAFTSASNNLVPDDANGVADTFVHDRVTKKTERISLNSSEKKRRYAGYGPRISADGRFVAFESDNPFAPGDKNGWSDIFIRDRLLQKARNADLQVEVTEQPNSVVKGQRGHYTLTITNAGPDNAAAVNVTDVISHGMATSLTSSQGRCSNAAVSVCRLGSLEAGASATVVVTLQANRNPLRQQISVNAAPVDSTPLNNTATLSTPVTQ